MSHEHGEEMLRLLSLIEGSAGLLDLIDDRLLAPAIRRGGYCTRDDLHLLWPSVPEAAFADLALPALTVANPSRRDPGRTTTLFRVSEIDQALSTAFRRDARPTPLILPALAADTAPEGPR